MTVSTADFHLTMEELREVARYAVESAEPVLVVFEDARPDDPRRRAAIEAAWTFARGAPRSNLQRVTALNAHRAAKEAPTEAAAAAARAAGDAAAAAYLHPLARATQVGHILRAAACAGRASELAAGGDLDIGRRVIELAAKRATPTIVDVLRRYPPAPSRKTRVGQLMKSLDDALRSLNFA